MGKYEKKGRTGGSKQKKRGSILTPFLIALGIVLVAAFVMFVMPQLLYRLSNPEDETQPQQTQPNQTVQTPQQTTAEPQPTVTELTGEALSFPMALEGGLEIESLFAFDGVNPDCGNKEGKDIASIVLNNSSGTYLAEADVTLILRNGTVLRFRVTDVPAGKSVMAFDLDNQTLESDAECVQLDCVPVFDPDAAAESKQVSVSVSGMTIEVVNNTGKTVPEVLIYCHSPLGEKYFGGITYVYQVSDLPAKGTATVEAVDCILGLAEVVRVTADQE